MTKKILIATGGTGGHVYPATALAQQLIHNIPGAEVLFVGGGLDANRYFHHQEFKQKTIACGSFVSKSPKALASSFFNICKGVLQSRSIIKEFRPDVAVGFGSFYAFPPLVAAKLMEIPIVLHESNSIPGKVNRFLAKWAEVTGVHFPETSRLLKGHSVEVGMPLRKGYSNTEVSYEEAKEYFGLKNGRKTLLVFGGSQGARAINLLVMEALGKLQNKNLLQVVHFTGDLELAHKLQKCYLKEGIHACVKAFENQMAYAWQAADVLISRSGAGTIAEQLEFEVPGILIPYPNAADNHQECNADFMVSVVGGAVKLNEKGLDALRLACCLEEFLKGNGEIIEAMQSSMKSYKKKARTKDLFSLVNDQFS